LKWSKLFYESQTTKSSILFDSIFDALTSGTGSASPAVSAKINPVNFPAVLEKPLNTSLEKSISKAQELAALPDGAWLALDKQALRLLDARGKQLAQLPMRAKHLDTRSHAQGALAIVLDADSQRPIPIVVNLTNGTLQLQAAFPEPAFSVETLCLYRDAQQLDYLFLVGKDGLSEQWAMQGDLRKLVRKLALPPHAKHCRSDDQTHTLFVSESNLGLWAYAADPEGVEAVGLHKPLILRAPYGHVSGGTGAFVVLPGGLAVLDSKGENLHLLRQHQASWQQLPVQRLRYKHEIAQMSVRQDGNSIHFFCAMNNPRAGLCAPVHGTTI